MAGQSTIRAGELRHRVTVQHRVNDGQDDNGEFREHWADVATVFAKIEPMTGREHWNGDQVASEVTHRVITRHGSHLDGYSSAWRLVFGTRIFEVESVTLRNETKWTVLEWACREAGRLTTDPEAGQIVLN